MKTYVMAKHNVDAFLAKAEKEQKLIQVCLACHFCGKLYDKNHFIETTLD